MSETEYEQIEITEEQQASIDRQNALAEEEGTWPIFTVELQGDETEWAFREAPEYYDEDGNPRDGEAAPKVRKAATCQVLLHARNEDMAKARALNANPDYHTVVSVTENE